MKNTKVCVIGLGYIGLPTAALIASRGFNVCGVDINQTVIDTINSGKVHIIEPDLDEAVHNAVKSGNLKAVINPEKSDIFIISVPTPFKENHKPDLRFVEAATRSIAPYLEQGNIVILESTSPVGTTKQMASWLTEERPDLSKNHSITENIHMAYCPERVLPGNILKELISNDRIIGGLTDQASQRAAEFFKIFVEGDCVVTNAETAEMCKLTENTARDVSIAFANELSLICDEQNIDVWELIQLANLHPRVNILQPGPGVGGHCIAVDPWFIVDRSPQTSQLIKTARTINDNKPNYVLDKIHKAIANNSNPIVACFGAAFKPNIDDLRESPALYIIEQLASKESIQTLVVEPHITELPGHLAKQDNVTLCSASEAITQADLAVVLVAHDTFKQAGADFFKEIETIFTVKI